MDILCVCIGGENRSPYLARYLRGCSPDYNAKSFAAMLNRNQERFDQQDLIIILGNEVKALLDMREYNLEGKTIIELNVEDISEERDYDVMEEDIRTQIAPHLPLEDLMEE